MRGRRWLWLGLCLWGAVACDVRPEAPAVANCPPCECTCNCDEAKAGAPALASTPVAPTSGTGAGKSAGEPALPGPPASPNTEFQRASDIGELVASATRKLHFDDGKGCLADLDRIAAVDPKYDARLAVTRGMCEMRAGRCQDGKRRVAQWYQSETNLHPERAAVMAESIAAMHCRGGDSTDRDRLLRAYYDLSDGAYMNKKSVAECREALDTARKLIPKIKPNGPDDHQIKSTPQALFHTAATCFGRAGDCKRAFAVYRELYPDLSQVPDAAMRDKIIRDSFDSSILHCAANAGAPAPAAPPAPARP